MNMRRLGFSLIVMGCLVMSTAKAGAVDALDNAGCMTCHGDATMAPAVDEAKLKLSVHSNLNCVDCHSGIIEVPHAEKLAPVECGTCHEGAVKEFSQSVHGALKDKNISGVPQCWDCHGTHDIFSPKDLRSLVNHFKVDQLCLKCHTSEDLIKLHPNMPKSEFAKGYQDSVHGRGVHLKGLSVSATCIDCHGSHKILPANQPESHVAKKNIPQTCKTCHEGIFNDYVDSIHGKLWKEGVEVVPVCSDCHEPHNMQEPRGIVFRKGLSQQCGKCHDDKVSTYKDTFHGKATSFGYYIAADCSDCHTAHRILPKNDPRSSVNPAHIKETCGQCHSASNANFVNYNPHIDSHNPQDSALVYNGLRFMNGLLLVVFGFFTLHTLLWLQRLAVGFLRREYKLEKYSGDHVLRFSRVSRLTHMVMVVSFLMLAATGLPLKFNTAGWAKVIMMLMGGIEVTRVVHRFFAIVTFGYLFFHLGQLMWEIYYKKRHHILRGHDTLIPTRKDLKDLMQNLKWFFYLGPPPKYGKWTYFEKFDYFAVLWGVPVIGMSGLILWFPTFFTKFLPGPVLNLAAIVHSEEALLAVGFIFTFHFFHNHLRLENFPMDITIFSGTVPLERFKKERPVEYRRLMREGRLHEVLVPPPAQDVIRRCQIFGFVTLMIGLILLISIFISFILGIFHH